MRFHLAALILPAALLVAACDENAPPDRDSQSASVNRTLSNPSAQAPGRTVADTSINIPKGAMWTICCDTINTPDHVQRAAELKAQLIRLTGRHDFYVVHKEGASVVYFGFYTTIRQDVNPAEHARSQADLQWVRALTDSQTGQPIFREPIILPIDGPNPSAPLDWNLANAPADMFWSLQIAAYKDFAGRKEAAVDKVRELRKQGIPAYFYHGESVSSVCVGLWPITAVKNQAEGDPYHGARGGTTVDPNQPLYVIGGTQAPDNAQDTRIDPSTGQVAKVMGVKLDIQDPTLKATIDKYPYEDVNGEYHFKPLPDGGKYYDQSFLVQVPHDKQSDQVATPQQPGASDDLPPLPDTVAPADPTEGALRSLGDK